MADIFACIWGQPKVREYFRAAIANDALSHAYMLVGPAGSGKTQAAYALAAARICSSKGCGECDTCKRVMRKLHPDVHYFAPEGASAYLVGQMRQLMSDVSLAPIQAKAKVYIVDRADKMSGQAANAFLKTLEEPPADVMIILLARTVDAVLPTITSRCQVVPFRAVPESEAIGLISQNAGVTNERARMALAACDGSVERAVEFAQSNDRVNAARRAFEDFARLRTADDWDVIQVSRRMVEAAGAPLDDVRRDQEEYLEANADFLSKGAVKQLRERDERANKAAARLAQVAQLSLLKSWLHDVMMACLGQSDKIVNAEARAGIEDASCHTDEARVARAILAVDKSCETLSRNVSVETCFDALLFEIREVLYD